MLRRNHEIEVARRDARVLGLDEQRLAAARLLDRPHEGNALPPATDHDIRQGGASGDESGAAWPKGETGIRGASHFHGGASLTA